MDYTRLTLAQVYDEMVALTGAAQTLFGELNAQQLNWKPAADSWSVAQCLDHLTTINREYYPTFDRILNGQHRRRLLHRLPLLPALSGRMMIKVLSPQSRGKYKAPRVALPSSSTIEPTIVARFVAQQQETLARMKALESKHPDTVVITSPFAKAIAYSLLDTFRLLVAHERRHFAQAQRVMQTQGFPRAAR
jgi:hypothetical protein